MFLRQFHELLKYPRNTWDHPASERWEALCLGMRDYQGPCSSFTINKERKWELVSAFQKSIRRGDKQMALRLVSAMDSMPEESAYVWKRFCVIVCEDVGPADGVLASFLVACATVFTPKVAGNKNYDLLCFLAEQMCDLSTRSHVYCSYAQIESAASDSPLPVLGIEDDPIVSAIMQRKEALQAAKNLWQQWQKKNNWRTHGLLQFVGLRLPLEMIRVDAPVPAYKMLFGLPSYCYDVYTRIGLTMLRRLAQGVEGA